MNEYREGDRVLYVSIVNDRGENLFVSNDKLSSKDPIWQQVNNVFEQSFFHWLLKFLMDPIYTMCLRLYRTNPSAICWRMMQLTTMCWCLRLNLSKMIVNLNNASFPPNLILSYNAHNSKDIEVLLEFANGFLKYDAPLLLFIAEFNTVRDDVRACVCFMWICIGKRLVGNKWIVIASANKHKNYSKLFILNLQVFFNICELSLLFDIVKNNYFLIMRIQHCI